MTQSPQPNAQAKKVIIAGSAKLVESVLLWRRRWENAGYEVIDYPRTIPKDSFQAEYPGVYQAYYLNLIDADVLFVLNEDRDDQIGYVGAETFAEMAFAVACNQVMPDASQRIIMLQRPDTSTQSFDEVDLWLELGWVELLDESNLLETDDEPIS